MARRIHMGTLARPHGIKGEICVDWYADSPSLLDGPFWLQAGDAPPRPARARSWRMHKGRPLLLLEGVTGRNDIEALRGQKILVDRDLLPPVDWDQLRSEIRKFYPNYEEPRSLISFAMYPKVYEEYIRHRKEYGYIMRMGSHVFFNGMAIGEMNKINIEDGKTLMIKYIGLGDRNDDGTRNVQFELNGMRREVSVPDPTATDSAKTVVMADPNDKSQAGASIPGMVSKVNVKPGDQVKVNDVLAVIEAMKMETSVVARMDGTVDEVFVKGGQSVKAGELLLTIK